MPQTYDTGYTLSRYDLAEDRLVDAYETAAAYSDRARYPKGGSLAERAANVEEIVKRAGYHAANLTPSKRALWLAACAWDQIDPNAPSVDWSDDNPYAPFYDTLTR